MVFLLRPLFQKKPGGIDWIHVQPKDADCDYMASLIFEHANDFRRHHNLPALTDNTKLQLAAHNHAYRMALSGEFDHVLSDGVELRERVERSGYLWKTCRENIALFQDPSRTIRELAWEMHDGWVHSPGHRANLMADDVVELGVSVVRASDGSYYAVQNFGTPQFGRAVEAPRPVALSGSPKMAATASPTPPVAPTVSPQMPSLHRPTPQPVPVAPQRGRPNVKPPTSFREYLREHNQHTIPAERRPQ